MKKFLLSLATLALYASFVSADTLYELTFNKDNNQQKISAYDKTWDVVSDGSKWTVSGYNNNNNGAGEGNFGTDKQPQTPWTFVRCGRKKSNTVTSTTATIATDFAADSKIDQIVIDGLLNGANSGDNLMTSAKVLIANASTFADNSIVGTVNIPVDEFTGAKNTEKTITVTIPNPQSGLYYKIVFDMTAGSANGWLQINSVKYNGESAGPQLADPEIAFPTDSYSATLGTIFESPVASAKSNGIITYSISNEDVATIDAETGVVTPVAEGTAVVTATIEATDVYKAGSTSYTLNVIDPTIVYRSVLGDDFTFENVTDETYPWSHDAKYGLKGTGFINKAIVACEGIAASPVLDMTKFEDIKLDFSQAFNNYKVDNVNIDVADFDGYAFLVAREEGASEWTVIENAITAPESFSWTFYPNATVDLSAYDGKKFQFGFKYVSTDECAGTWEVKDIKVRANNSTGVADVESDNDIAPVYYNLQGVRVANPENGLYIEVKGNKSRKVIF